MADAAAKDKAEKVAAARKRVEALKKKNAKSTGPKTTKKAVDPSTEEDAKGEESKVPDIADEDAEEQSAVEPVVAAPEDSSRNRAPSLSLQSKLRSSSFRQASFSGGPLSPGSPASFSPDGDTAPDVFRKQVGRIEELEKENKRLAKEAHEGEIRWQKAEEELEDMREASAGQQTNVAGKSGISDDVARLRSEIVALQRQNSQLLAQVSKPHRHGASPSISIPANSDNELTAALASKSSTIESMEIELSNLRAQLTRTSSGSTAEKEQIAALEDKFNRTNRSLEVSQRELGDLKKNLEHSTAKAVKEGSERMSAETKLRYLTREAEEAKTLATELQRKVEGLEKKVTTLTTIHKEHDVRSQALRRERERSDKEATDLRLRLGRIENENLRLREERERVKKREAQGIDDEGVDELENEERQRLEQKVHELEGEIFDLRRGVWKEKRDEIDGSTAIGETIASPGGKFTDIDLGGMSPSTNRKTVQSVSTKGITDFFNAFTGASENEQLLEDDDMDFDEDAFRLAREDEMKKRIERIKDIKRSLNDWKGWRLNLVETRKVASEGTAEIFEV